MEINKRFLWANDSPEKKPIPTAIAYLFHCVYPIQWCLPNLIIQVWCAVNIIQAYRIEGAQELVHMHAVGSDSSPGPGLAPIVWLGFEDRIMRPLDQLKRVHRNVGVTHQNGSQMVNAVYFSPSKHSMRRLAYRRACIHDMPSRACNNR